MKNSPIRGYARVVSDYLTFIRALPDSFSEIGAMLPSSPALGKLMVEPLRHSSGPRRILEIGPGTGPFTRQILELMGPEDEFVICEINPSFMKALRRKLRLLPHFKAHRAQTHFYLGPIQELPESLLDGGFDVIVSSLPFHNFDPREVESLFQLFSGMLRPGGTLSFFHYLGLRKMCEFAPKKDVRQRVRGVDTVIDHWCECASQSGHVVRKVSLLNFPPAMSVQLAF